MKKLINLIAGLMIIMNVATVSAKDDVTVKLNGQKIYFDQQPVIYEGRTLVPMRAIFEAMGCEVQWDDGMIDVYKDDINVMTLWVDDYEMWLPSGNIYLDVAPMIINDRTLVPIRAISESMGARVDWNGTERLVSISYTYNDENECEHERTHIVCSIDLRKFENTGDKNVHNVIDTVNVVCDICDKTIENDTERIYTRAHKMKNGVCDECGYSNQTNEEPKYEEPEYNEPEYEEPEYEEPVYSSDEITAVSDGTFLHITVPKGKSIKIPNATSGTLPITMKGEYHAMTFKNNVEPDDIKHSITTRKYNIQKNSYGIIQSLDDGLVASIPLENADYQETSDKVFNTVNLSLGDNAKFVNISDSSATVYFSQKNYECIEYNDKLLKNSNLRGRIYNTFDKSTTLLITTTDSLSVDYCPYTIKYSYSNDAAFKRITLAPGEKIRIHSSENSKAYVYTDGNNEFNYVVYDNDGRVKSSSSKPVKDKDILLLRERYMDMTNVSGSSMEIKLTNIYSRVEK